MRIRSIVQVLASLTVLALAPGASRPALAQSFELLAPACQFTGSASKVLRRIKKTGSSVTLLKATSIFPCDVQSRFIEALGKELASGKDQSELHSILDRALDKATTLETACVRQMTWFERSAFDALSDDDEEEGTETVALLMFRFPCTEERTIIRKRAAPSRVGGPLPTYPSPRSWPPEPHGPEGHPPVPPHTCAASTRIRGQRS